MKTRYNLQQSAVHSIRQLFTLTICSFLFCSTSLAQSWNQLGADIDGATGNGYGGAVAMSSDGSIIAIGASSAASNRGSVVVYERAGSSWTIQGDTIKGASSGDLFGTSVSLSTTGHTLAIGVPGSKPTGGSTFDPSSGHVEVYDLMGGSWIKRGDNLEAAGVGESFGADVSLSADGNVVAAGAPGAADSRGAVRVYQWNISSWDQVGTDITGSIDFEGSGSAVSLKVVGTDTIVAVGSPQYFTAMDFVNAENEGRVRIFTLSGNDWGIPEELTGDPFQSLGASVDLSDDATRLVAGAPYDYIGLFAPGPFIGRVLVYENASGWSQLGSTIVSSTALDEFGVKVSISGDGSRVIAGAPRVVVGDSPNGRVEVYEYTSDWMQVGGAISGEAPKDGFGSAVAISNDGSIVALGDPSNDDFGADAGHVRVFEYGIPTSNSSPVITAAQSFTIEENAPNGSSPGTVLAMDANAGTVFSSWSITAGNDDGVFAIAPTSGVLSIASNTNLDFETTPSYTLTLTVSDGTDTSAPVDISIAVDDLNDNAPEITASQSFEVTEDAVDGASIGAALAIDADAGTTFSSWSITAGNDDGVFAIDAASGVLSVASNATLDIETIPVYTLTLTVSDGTDTSPPVDISITVIGVDETAPTVALMSVPTIINDRVFTVTFDFSEEVTGFEGSDVTLVNAALSNFLSTDASTYTADITPDGNGDITINVAAAVAQDAAGNGNTAATQAMIAYDRAAPQAFIAVETPDRITAEGVTILIFFMENDRPEAVTDAALSTLTVTNGEASNFAESTTFINAYEVDITPDGNGDVTINIAAGVVTDLAGNENTAAEPTIIPYDDGIAPVVTVDDININKDSPQLTGTVDDFTATVSVTVDDQTHEATNNGAGTWTLAEGTLDPLAGGEYTITAVATDVFDNESEPIMVSLTIDLTSPAVSFYVTNLDGSSNIIFTNSINSINSNNTIRVGIIFDEAVEGFDSDGVVVQGASKNNFISYGIDEATGNDQYSINATPDGSGDDLFIVVSAGATTDIAGNSSGRGEYTVIYDVTAPEITSIATAGNTNGSTVPIRITFNEKVTDLTATDLTVGNGTVSGDPATLDSLTYTIRIAPTQEGNVTVQLNAASVQDLAGNISIAASDELSFLYDRTAPTATITAPEVATANPVEITVTFSEAMRGLVADDLTLTNGAVAEITTVDNIRYTVEITATDPSEDGPTITGFDLTVALAAGEVLDRASNGNSTVATQTILFDDISPIIDFVNFTEQTIAGANGDFGGFIIFSESETITSAANNIEVVNGTISGYSEGQRPNGEPFYTLAITVGEDANEVLITIPEGIATDAAGNENEETTFTIVIDTEAPKVVITSSANDPTNVSPIPVTLTFSEKVIRTSSFILSASPGFNLGELVTEDSIVYSADITPSVDEGTLSLTIPVRYSDLAGNQNEISEEFTLIYDAKAPSLTIDAPDAVNSTDPFAVTFAFDEPVTSFDDTNVTVTNATLGVITTGANNSYTAQITPSGESEMTITVAGASDEIGNVTTELSQTVLFDTVAPTVTITGLPENSIFCPDAIKATIAFSKPVEGFSSDGLSIDNGRISDFRGTGEVYTVNVAPDIPGTITLIVKKNSATDLIGNPNEAGRGSYDYELKFNGGCGTETDPFRIVSESDLRELSGSSADFGAHFLQTENIEMSSDPFTPIGTLERAFTGTYDGQGFTINNLRNLVSVDVLQLLSFNGPYNARGAALFGLIKGGNLKDIGLTSIDITNAVGSGAEQLYTGGLVSVVATDHSKTIIENCYVTGRIGQTSASAGGLVGVGFNLEIKNCFTNLVIAGAFNSVGGLVGSASGVNIDNSYSNTTFSELWDSPLVLGGLIGNHLGSPPTTITNSYFAGTSDLSVITGLAGLSVPDARVSIVNSFWDKELSGIETNPAGGTGLTTSEMRERETYEGWDFENTWTHVGTGYHPVLKWQVDNAKPFTVSGKVVDKDGEPFSAGTVKAIFLGFLESKTADLAADGSFTLEDIPAAIHAIVIEPNANEVTHVKTYYGDANRSTLSRHVFNSVSGIEIQMIAKSDPNQLTGNGIVSGRVVDAGASGGRIVQGRILEGEGLEGVTVFLVRTSDEEILTQVETDENGDFEITGIPAGEYQLLLDVVGIDVNLGGSSFTMDEEGTPLTISAAISEEGIEYFIEAVVLGVEDQIALAIYPNPTTHYATIEVQGEATLRVMELSGAVRLEQAFYNTTKLDVSQFKEGIHLLEISTAEGVAIRKLIKK